MLAEYFLLIGTFYAKKMTLQDNVINGNTVFKGLPLKTKVWKKLDRKQWNNYPRGVTFTFQGGES